ncbi:hypothetical protein DTO027I6_1055 [Penicillium roqueforti]|nr:hypothetical protein CBS147355_409 [Penicillium roqueforti]KAI3170205.1 hypothetical protein DTO039G3_4434 [Penicillium roqueforti]KAI3219787.1 hypothetical protein DTO027I6_1055 [Penicillium roqueforti]
MHQLANLSSPAVQNILKLVSLPTLTHACHSYSLGPSTKLNSFKTGERFHLAKSCPFSTKICRSTSPLSTSVAGHTPSHTITYGSTTPKTSLSHLHALPSSILPASTIPRSSSSRKISLSRLSTAARITPRNIYDRTTKSNSPTSAFTPIVSSTATAAKNFTSSSLPTSPSHPLYHAYDPTLPSGNPHHITSLSHTLSISGSATSLLAALASHSCAEYFASHVYKSYAPCATSMPKIFGPHTSRETALAEPDRLGEPSPMYSSQKRAYVSE